MLFEILVIVFCKGFTEKVIFQQGPKEVRKEPWLGGGHSRLEELRRQTSEGRNVPRWT